MIKSELEYQVSQEWVLKFNKSLSAMEDDEERKKNDFEKWELNRSALQTHLDKLHQEITEYEQLTSCDKKQPVKIQVESFNKLPDEIFDHLYTTKVVGKGTGLGLAIARQIIVDKHGGSIEVNSTLGEGTEFRSGSDSRQLLRASGI